MLDNSLFRTIAFHASVAPNRVAIFAGGAEISYARFRDDIDAVTCVLAAEKLDAGTRVAILVDKRYLNWTIVFACMRLQLPSVHIDEAREFADVGDCVVITDTEPPAGAAKVIRVSQASIRQGAEMVRHKDVAPDPEALCRVILSSGTTGVPKKIPLTYEEFRQRCLNVAVTYQFDSSARFLCAMGAGTVGGFIFPCAAWTGGACLVMRAPELVEAYRTGRPTIVLAAPTFLEKLVEAAGESATAPPDAPTLYVGGSMLRDSLNEAARKRLSPALFVAYGSTEATTVTMAPAAAIMNRPGCVGFALPYAEIQIVDKDHQPVAQGTEGIVRVRSEGMADEYLGDAEATSRAFHDGWFYPGDMGRIDRLGALHLTGRADEIANLAGLKLSPERIDAVMRDVPGVKDAAAFSVPGDPHDELWLALVEGEGFEGAVLRARYVQAFPRQPFPKLMRLESIPRNAMGKVRRLALREAVKKTQANKPHA